MFAARAAAALAGHAAAAPWPAAAAPMGGASPVFAGRVGPLPSAALDCAGVIPDEDILTMHDAMEFHLGGRHWLDLVPRKRTSTDLVCNRPSCDDGSACAPASNGPIEYLFLQGVVQIKGGCFIGGIERIS